MLILNFISIVIFTIDACILACDKHKHLATVLLMSFLTTFGGGAIIRDIIIIKRIPSCILSPLDVLVWFVSAWIVIIIYHFDKSHIFTHNKFIQIRYLFDKLGTGTFIVLGIFTGLSYNLTPAETILCGIAPGVGGGILAKFLYISPYDVFLTKKRDFSLCSIVSVIMFVISTYIENKVILSLLATLLTILVYELTDILSVVLKNSVDICMNIYRNTTLYRNNMQCTTPIFSPNFLYVVPNNSKPRNRHFKFARYVSRFGKYRYVIG